jgi:Uma2 family endonuclease
MVALKDNSPRFTPEEYFAWEEQQLERHELIDGEVYAMTQRTVISTYRNISLIWVGALKLKRSGSYRLSSVKVVTVEGYISFYKDSYD